MKIFITIDGGKFEFEFLCTNKWNDSDECLHTNGMVAIVPWSLWAESF